ncbi:hypothetical protein C8Q79DRAFT_180293 [Trametes meyenii]|nr:hypothetical protein C8Q79DRAFT_180293 [Trametes meyenii]
MRASPHPRVLALFAVANATFIERHIRTTSRVSGAELPSIDRPPRRAFSMSCSCCMVDRKAGEMSSHPTFPDISSFVGACTSSSPSAESVHRILH